MKKSNHDFIRAMMVMALMVLALAYAYYRGH